MINYILYLLNKPSKGWDPVPSNYAENYASVNYAQMKQSIVDVVEKDNQTLVGKSLLDLGAGPGQYSIAFTKKGTQVTWHDISKNYMEICKTKALEASCEIKEYILDYMDNITGQYDIIFSRVCWFYCMHDKSFAKKIVSALKPNGYAYIAMHNEDFMQIKKNETSAFKYFLITIFHKINNITGVKIGHPHMSKRRIEELFNSLPIKNLEIVHDNVGTSVVKFRK